MSLSNLNSTELTNVQAALDLPADQYGNDQSIELQWAMKAYHHAETYFSLITAVDPKALRLTPQDNDIYELFRKSFPDLNVEVIDVDAMKSEEGKAKWREFCEEFKEKVEDYNMGSLLRVDCKLDVSDSNTTLAPRVQFLAIEIARNREGYNSGLREKYKKQKSGAS